MNTRKKGFVLLAIIIVAVILAIVGLGTLILAEQESVLTSIDADKSRAFYLAEAGLAKMQEALQSPVTGDVLEVFAEPLEETLENGSYSVELVEEDANYFAVSTGVSGGVQKQVRAQADFLAAPYENAVFAANKSGANWAFQLRGIGDPCQSMGTNQWGDPVLLSKGGKDKINGNIVADGSVFVYGESRVDEAPAPNKWELNGDVSATGSIFVSGTAYVNGDKTQNAAGPDAIDLISMDYANNNTHNVAQILSQANNELQNVFVKNPQDGTRKAACSSTSVNDYFFEPTSGFVDGTAFTGETPLHMGSNRVYYVDGDVWVHSDNTKGFKIDGTATIVATGNIHICDNLQYKDTNSLLGLVALGKYNSEGNLISGGNIYFGDPVNGTMGYVSAMMFAANDFLYNTDPQLATTAEPRTGFTIVGSFAALNTVSIILDWYTPGGSGACKAEGASCNKDSECCSGNCSSKGKCKSGSSTGSTLPAKYDPGSSKWLNAKTGVELSTTEISTLQHYQMIINYDDNVRSPKTRPPGLPLGVSNIFAGFSNWEEL